MGSDDVCHKPFILAVTNKGTVSEAISAFSTSLTGANFEIVGTYALSDAVQILCFTNSELKAFAAKSERGAFGAVLRLSATLVGEEVQVAYTNPTYMAFAMRMEGDNAALTQLLKDTLGFVEEYGSKKGLSEKKVRKYHYAVGMEYFNEPDTLRKFDSYEAAVEAVDAALGANTAGVTKVFRVDIPDKKETVFGCGLKSDDKFGDDTKIMQVIDFGAVKSSAHLPYELVVSDKKVIMLHARFRIAVNFTDLEMTGDHSFMKIMDTPKTIKKMLTLACGGKN